MTDLVLGFAEELYGMPLAEFTSRRDALVKEHRGDKELAARIKALRKPSMAGWVLNLLVRRDPDQVEQVLNVGAALRDAQASLDADQLREFTKQRRQLTAAVTTSARRLAREAGQRVTESVAEQVEATLTAAMIDATAARALRTGLLVSGLSATGVDEVDVTRALALPDALGFVASAHQAPPPPRPELRLVPDPDAHEKAVRAADEAVAAATVNMEAATMQADAATADVEDCQARTLQFQAQVDELRGRLAELETQLEEIDVELEDAEDAQGIAEHGVAQARAELARAAEARARLGD